MSSLVRVGLVSVFSFSLFVIGCSSSKDGTSDGSTNDGSAGMDDGGLASSGGAAGTSGTGVAAKCNGVTLNANGMLVSFSGATVMVNDPPQAPATTWYTALAANSGSMPLKTFQLQFPGDTVGTFSCPGGNLLMLEYGESGPAHRTSSGSSCSVNVTEFGASGGVISGTFSATIPSSSGDFVIADGCFSVRRP